MLLGVEGKARLNVWLAGVDALSKEPDTGGRFIQAQIPTSCIQTMLCRGFIERVMLES
jgi:hypothetical protein